MRCCRLRATRAPLTLNRGTRSFSLRTRCSSTMHFSRNQTDTPVSTMLRLEQLQLPLALRSHSLHLLLLLRLPRLPPSIPTRTSPSGCPPRSWRIPRSCCRPNNARRLQRPLRRQQQPRRPQRLDATMGDDRPRPHHRSIPCHSSRCFPCCHCRLCLLPLLRPHLLCPVPLTPLATT